MSICLPACLPVSRPLPFSLPPSLSVCLAVCLCVCLSVCLSVSCRCPVGVLSMLVRPSVCLRRSVCPLASVRPFANPPVFVSTSAFASVSARVSFPSNPKSLKPWGRALGWVHMGPASGPESFKNSFWIPRGISGIELSSLFDDCRGAILMCCFGFWLGSSRPFASSRPSVVELVAIEQPRIP